MFVTYLTTYGVRKNTTWSPEQRAKRAQTSAMKRAAKGL